MRPHRIFVCLILSLVSATQAWAQDKKKTPAEVAKSLAAVRTHIDNLKFGKDAGSLRWMDDGPLPSMFADYHFINARFPVFPVARVIPEGLRASSVFAVHAKEGKITFLKDTQILEKFFRAHHKAVKDDKDARTILAFWLFLSVEFHQDGYFIFEPVDVAVDGKNPFKARGRAVVMKGGNGQLSAELLFDKVGTLAKVTEKAEIRAGVRPICQATKLLDADPIVRRIAEQDLLIMGVSARDYLMGQRERATPELREAIDRLWTRIQKNGW